MVLLPDNDPPFDDASLIEFVARRARLDEMDLERLQRLGEPHGPLGRAQAIGHRVRRHHHVRRVAVQAVDRERQVALLALGRDAGRRSAAHHVHQHHGHLGPGDV